MFTQLSPDAIDREFDKMLRGLPLMAQAPEEDEDVVTLTPIRDRFPELVFRRVELPDIKDILAALRGCRGE